MCQGEGRVKGLHRGEELGISEGLIVFQPDRNMVSKEQRLKREVEAGLSE